MTTLGALKATLSLPRFLAVCAWGVALCAPALGLADTSSIASDFGKVLVQPTGVPVPKFVSYGGRFPGNTIVWYYNSTGAPATLSDADVVDSMALAGSRWSAVCNVNWFYGGKTSAPALAIDGKNVIGWSTAYSYAGYTQDAFWTPVEITESDIALHPTQVTLRAVADALLTHELGHMLGLDHSNVEGVVMSGPPLTSYGGYAQYNVLKADDIAGCQALYGPPQGIGLPMCIMGIDEAYPVVGSNLSLTALCANHPTAYNWTNCSSTGPTCTATSNSVGPVTYSFTASNAVGSILASQTITWLAPTQPPVCSLSASSTTPLVGSSVTLTASCSNAPTSYAWTGCASTGPVCTTTSSVVGPANYSVTARNGVGISGAVGAAVTWTAATPVCSLSADRASALVGSTVLLSASCTNGPILEFQWTNCASTTANCATSASVAGPTSFAVTARNANGWSLVANAFVSWQAAAMACTGLQSAYSATIGEPVTLTASCSPNAATFAWVNCASSSANCTPTPPTVPGPQHYSAVATGPEGTQTTVNFTVTWQSTAMICTGTQSATAAVLGQEVTLSTSCVPTAAAYNWANCNDSTTSMCTPASPPQPGPQTYTVNATAGAGMQATVTFQVIWRALENPNLGLAVEYYHADLDHYFITALAAEIQALDAGAFKGWARTGESFLVAVPTAPAAAGLVPVCRFYGSPARGLDSHFYSALASECEHVVATWPDVWLLESRAVFQVYLPDATNGACPVNTRPVYRMFNQRSDVNHRYTGRIGTRDRMQGLGYVAEGYGDPAVAFCTPTL